MIIARASAADVAAIAALVNGAYRGASARAGWTDEAGMIDGQRTDPPTLLADIEAGATILLAREPGDGGLIGCVQVQPGAAGAWSVGMLSVSPLRQASGTGRVLLEAAEHQAWGHGATRIVLKVIHLRESLIAWYERRGYRRCTETAAFPYGDDRFGIPQRADLYFIVLEKRASPL